jgi:ubiquitin C-terminal hydrolase
MIDDLFGGQLQSTLTCNTCGWQSHCFDPCLGVSVPIPKKRPVTVEVSQPRLTPGV